MTAGEARRAAERAARQSYGKLVAILSARTRDVAAAEDALADAFRSALQTWPERGVPDRPEAWLITAARRSLGHVARHARVVDAGQAMLEMLAHDDEMVEIADQRLALLFICAHPAIDRAVQAPLMLQTVLGLDAQRIAACFLTSPAAMGQRLVRAKAKIRDAGIAFAVPDRDALPARLDAVLSAIYAAYGTGWEDVHDAEPRGKGLAEEALWLARVVVGLLPASAEARGLLALMLHCEARRPARRDGEGCFVPLDRQDPARWRADMIAEAEAILASAGRMGRPGRFQIEAAIQSVHAARARTGATNWPALVALYDHLAALAPAVGVLVARAAATAAAGDPAAAIVQLDGIGDRRYQPWWAARARALTLLGRHPEAAEAFATAAGLTEDAAVRAYLLAQISVSPPA
ncbi:MAG: RNA polymerase sigma factor [Ferrovibrionaceae bacterium]